MAKVVPYARLGLSNMVMRIDLVKEVDCMTSGGLISDAMAFDVLNTLYGAGVWVQTAKDGSIRGKYPGGAWDQSDPWYYDATLNVFHKSRPTDKDGDPCTSWTLNGTTGVWDPPITKPNPTRAEIEESKSYVWDESAYQADNTKGWVLQ
tara:strand:+ start:95 stop:541 length:447 start_codon:yes stop_codon:yes gene_type:complete